MIDETISLRRTVPDSGPAAPVAVWIARAAWTRDPSTRAPTPTDRMPTELGRFVGRLTSLPVNAPPLSSRTPSGLPLGALAGSTATLLIVALLSMPMLVGPLGTTTSIPEMVDGLALMTLRTVSSLGLAVLSSRVGPSCPKSLPPVPWMATGSVSA